MSSGPQKGTWHAPVLRVLAGTLFIVAGVAKALALARGTLGATLVWDLLAGNRLAIGLLVLLEIVLGAFLISGLARRWATALTLVAVIGFSALVIHATLNREETAPPVTCGCFGGVSEQDDSLVGLVLLRNGLLALALLPTVIGARRSGASVGQSQPRTGGG